MVIGRHDRCGKNVAAGDVSAAEEFTVGRIDADELATLGRDVKGSRIGAAEEFAVGRVNARYRCNPRGRSGAGDIDAAVKLLIRRVGQNTFYRFLGKHDI